jgi:hypothetical protein
MHKLIGAACRRTAGMAAGVILAGGVAGGVLLTPGTAYAADPSPPPSPISTTTTMTATPNGTTLDVQVSVTAASGNVAPSGPVDVTGASDGCHIWLPRGGSGVGNCDITNLPAGTYPLTATYRGWAGFSSSSDQDTVTIGPARTFAPMFDVYWPPLTATAGQGYSYTFHASGSPRYALSGAPGWLNINPWNGTVWGTVPYGINSFSYSVLAKNSSGWATVGPFTVWVKQGYIDIHTYLSCPSYVFTGQQGRCTLWVANSGSAPAPDVAAQIYLPSQLRADYCGYYYFPGCYVTNNIAYQILGTLYPGQTRALPVVFTAKTGYSLWGRHHGHPFTVKVFGIAISDGYGLFPGQRQSFSVAYVTIIPHGHWW